mmetsp:Transcript_36322/g.92813  ORF Transcript_36322/g.92813 Transcript_36322/m.92813 type:complete len:398 (+) Transcript_36322:1012-2205(+)
MLARHAREAEHADLVGHVVPGAGGASGLQSGAQAGAHGDDAVRHGLHLAVPLLLQRGVAQDLGHNERAVQRGVGVGGAGDGLELALHSRGLRRILANHRQASDALAVQAHVLCVRLAQSNLVPILQEDLDGLTVLHAVTACKALVRHVKEGKVVLLLHHLAHSGPLLRGGVHAGGVVGAGVQQEHAAAGRCLHVLHHSLKVEAASLGLVVPVGGLFHPGVAPDVVVVGPGGHGDVDLAVGHVALLEVRHQAAGARAGQSLHRRDALLRDGGVVVAIGQLDGELVEGLVATHGQVLHELVARDHRLGLTHAVEHNRLAVVVAVGADAQVHLLGVGVCQELLGDAQDGILGRLRHAREARGGALRDRGPGAVDDAAAGGSGHAEGRSGDHGNSLRKGSC